MSDPVTNVEIEDVLSSIRRLVSEDARPRHVAANPMADRLVLTPSQRVPEPEVPNAPEDEASGDTGAGPQDPIVLTDYAAEPAANVGPPATEDSSDTDEPLTRHDETASEAAQSSAPEIEAEDRSDQDVAMNAPDTVSPDTDGEDAADDAEDTARDDTLARMVEQEVASALSEMSRTQDPLDVPPEPADDVETAEEVAQDDAPEPQVKPPSLEQKVAQLEAMIAGTEGDWETDEPAPEDTAAFLQDTADALPWQDYHVGEDSDAEDAKVFETSQKPAPAADGDADRPPAASETPQTEDLTEDDVPEAEPTDAEANPADTGTTDDADAFSVDDAPLIDEDMLRDMVAEIVRQELQGALGERITRNVRKLVRREIHRALLSQHLE